MKKLIEKINYQTRALFGLSLGHFNIDLYAALLVPLYPMITTKLGINLAYISFIIALGHLVSSMMQPVFGYIADKLRHRVFMVWGLVMTSIFIPFAIKTPTVALFLTCLLLGMIGNSFFHPQVSALIKDFNRNNPNLSRAMGIFLGLGTIGYALGPYIATFLVDNFGENGLLYMTVPGIISALFLYIFVPKKPPKDCYNKANFFLIMKEIIKNKTCVFLLIISVVKSAVSISFGTYIPFLLKENGFNLSLTGLVVTLFFIAGGIATIFSSKIEKKIGAKGVIVFSFVSILPLTILFLKTISTAKLPACLFFIMTGFFILLSVGIIMVKAQNAMPKYTGVISGVMQGFSWGLGAMFLAPLGVIGQNFGVSAILIIMSILALIVGIFSLRVNID